MKILAIFSFLSLAYLISSETQAASITVLPFKMTMEVQNGYQVKAQIDLACRYEKFVLSDSAEYEVFYQEPVQLGVSVKEDQGTGYKKVVLENNQKLYFEYDNPFRYGKECRASYKVFFESENYALGHTIKPKNPVLFTLWQGFYDYQEGNQVYDLEKMRKYLDQTTYSFTENYSPKDFVIIRILQDGREARTSPWVEKAYKNPKTGRPYRPGQSQE